MVRVADGQVPPGYEVLRPGQRGMVPGRSAATLRGSRSRPVEIDDSQSPIPCVMGLP